MTSSLTSVDTRQLRRLVWVNGMRFWNITKLVHDAHTGKPQAYLTRESLIQPKGGYFAVDLIGRKRDKDARLVLVREIHNSDQSMLVNGGIARIENKRIIADVPDLKILLPDSGARVNEITYQVADALGLYGNDVPKINGPLIQTNTGSYETWTTEFTLALDPEEVKKFQPKFASRSFPEISRRLTFHYPKENSNKRSPWDVLVGTEGVIGLDLVVEFVE